MSLCGGNAYGHLTSRTFNSVKFPPGVYCHDPWLGRQKHQELFHMIHMSIVNIREQALQKIEVDRIEPRCLDFGPP